MKNIQVKFIVNHVHTLAVTVQALNRQEAVAHITTLYRGNTLEIL